MRNKSFTLIELLVVIVIIGILAGVIIVSTSSSINKANFAKAQAFSNTVQQELLLNLVSEWTFDEGNAEDSWGNNDGTVSGATYVQKSENRCVYGGCYSFDGIDDYIEVANSTTLGKNYSSFTLSVWAKLNDEASVTVDGSYILQKNINNQMGAYEPIAIHYNNSKVLTLAAYSGTSIIRAQVVNPLGTEWHHILGDWDGQKIKLYFDGSLISTATMTSFANSTGYLTIGNSRYSPTYRPFKGLIDDVRIYEGALTTSQIKQEYIAGLNSLLANNNISKEEYDQRIESLAKNN